MKLAPPKRVGNIYELYLLYICSHVSLCMYVCIVCLCVCVCALINCNWRESVAVIMVIWQVFTLRLELGVTVICLNKENSCKKSEADEEEEAGEAGGEAEGGVRAMKLIYIRR